MNFKLIAVYGAFEALLLLGSAVFGRAWFYSSQVAFAGSLLVLAATFRAYKKRVENGVRDYDASAEDDIDEWGENHEEFPDRPAEAKFGGHDPHCENAKRLDVSNLNGLAKMAAKFDQAAELNLNGENELVKFDAATEQNEAAQGKFDEQNLNGASQNSESNLSKSSKAVKQAKFRAKFKAKFAQLLHRIRAFSVDCVCGFGRRIFGAKKARQPRYRSVFDRACGDACGRFDIWSKKQ